MPKKKILVYAYAISPTKGSEYSLAWDYVTEMSRDHELVVLYGMSGAHMGDTDEMESYLKVKPVPNVRFVAIKPNKLANILNIPNRHDFLVYSFYLAYQVWQRQVYPIAKELVRQEKFDLIHYLGPIGYRAPGYLWKLDLPYLWGPVGGTNNVPLSLVGTLPLSGKIKLGFRAVVNSFQLRYNPLAKKAMKRSNVLLAATTNVQKDLLTYFKVETRHLTESSIKVLHERNDVKFTDGKTKLIWIGALIERKALTILLQSLVLIQDTSALELHIVGDGPLSGELQAFAHVNGLDACVFWHGLVSRDQVFQLINEAHLHVVTSVSEGNPTVVMEAMSHGVPTMSLDHCGMHDTVCHKCGIKIPIESLPQVIRDIASNIERLLANKSELKRLSDGVLSCATQYTWEKRKLFFEAAYDQAILNWKQNNISN
jgi:glycosyltransferase involved in cell wall biosynthesis